MYYRVNVYICLCRFKTATQFNKMQDNSDKIVTRCTIPAGDDAALFNEKLREVNMELVKNHEKALSKSAFMFKCIMSHLRQTA